MTPASRPLQPSGSLAAGVLPEQDRLAWLAPILAPGLGPRRVPDVMRQLEAPRQIIGLPLTAIDRLEFPAAVKQYIFDGKARAAAEQE